MQWLEEGSLLLCKVYYVLLADGLTVHADALAEVNQMWRGV